MSILHDAAPDTGSNAPASSNPQSDDAKLATDLSEARKGMEDRGRRPRVGAIVAHGDYGIMRVSQAHEHALICRTVYDENGPTDGYVNGSMAFQSDDVDVLLVNGNWPTASMHRTIGVEHRGDRITVHRLRDVALTHSGLRLQVSEAWDSVDGDKRDGKLHSVAADDLTWLDTFGLVVLPERMRPTLPADLSEEPADEWVDEDPHDLTTPAGRADEASAILELFQQLQRRIDHDDARDAIKCLDVANAVENLALNTRIAAMEAELAERFPDRVAKLVETEADTTESEAA
ncbi:MAG: hypothetical protein AAGD32_13620 [Planctomycetota bacterium]